MNQSIIILALILAIVISFIVYPLAFYILIGILLLLLALKLLKSSGVGGGGSGGGGSSNKTNFRAKGYYEARGKQRVEKGYWGYYSGRYFTLVVSLLLIGAIIFGAWFLYSTGYYKIGTAYAETSSISAKLKTWSSLSYWQSKLSETYSFTNPESTEPVVKKGITFSDVGSNFPSYNIGEKIIITGNVHLDAIQEVGSENIPSEVVFFCKDDENNVGNIMIGSTDIQEQREVTVTEDSDFYFKCEIEPTSNSLTGDSSKTCEDQEGVPCDRSNKNNKCNGEWIVSSNYNDCCKGNCVSATTGEKIASTSSGFSKISKKIITIYARYKDFTTISSLEICSVSREELTKNRDKYEKKEENAQCIHGCGLTRLGLETSKQQPLSEDEPYPLRIGLVNDANWYGKIEKVNAINIDPPSNMGFIGDCKASINEQISAVNEQIKKSTEEKPLLNPFRCDFQVNEVENRLKCSIVEVSAKYDYIVEYPTVVEIVNKEKV